MMGTPPQQKKTSQHSKAMKKSSTLMAICVILSITLYSCFSHIALDLVSISSVYIIFAIELRYANDICQFNYLFLVMFFHIFLLVFLLYNKLGMNALWFSEHA